MDAKTSAKNKTGTLTVGNNNWDMPVYPGTIVTPYVQNGATDSRHFTRISRAVYRFSPFEMSKEERDTLHAKNERMHVATFLRGVEFYKSLVAAL